MTWRRSAAWVAVFALANLGASELATHAHPLGEVDLVAHSLFKIDHPPTRAAPLHLESAATTEHGACPECLLSAAPSDRSLWPLTPIALGDGVEQPLAAISDALFDRSSRSLPARAPPSPC